MFKFLRKVFGLCEHNWIPIKAKKKHKNAYKFFDTTPPIYGDWIYVPARDWTEVVYKCTKCKEIEIRNIDTHVELEDLK